MAEVFIGVDLGGTNIKVGCFDSQINLIEKTSVPTGAEMGPESVVERIVQAGKTLLAGAGVEAADVAAVGIGTPGPADYPNGIVFQCVNLPKFKNTPLRDMVAAGFGKPAVLENDANVACWGEFVVGAGRDLEDIVFFTLGTGIGGGIVCAGELVRGAHYNGAELGHLIIYPGGRKCNCGQRGCVEAYASASATARRAAEALQIGEESSLQKVLQDKGEITCKDVYDHLKTGDELARRITDETAEALAILCVNILHTTEPQRIFFAGGMIAAGDILLDRINHYFRENIWKLKEETVEICFATLSEDAGIIGAAALARHEKQHGKLG